MTFYFMTNSESKISNFVSVSLGNTKKWDVTVKKLLNLRKISQRLSRGFKSTYLYYY